MPIALVCEFDRSVRESTLAAAHKLAWNFSRAPLLITVEPHLVRAWTCCEPPSSDPTAALNRAEIPSARIDFANGGIAAQLEHGLHWVNLLNGYLFRASPERFRRQNCADQLLLENLDELRGRLDQQDLPADTIHDLLGRIIFVQFLFHRKDSSGIPALNSNVLERLHADRVLEKRHPDLPSVLRSHRDTYSLFRWLNEKFNGDLFPGKASTAAKREQEWRFEMNQVRQGDLDLLAEFISGDMQMRSGQTCLWPQYSFDAIPLEFISSIYETFVRREKERAEGVVYTPAYLVDFLLDAVLPWNSSDWNVRILDGACGSGIFLVKSFQRLVHRWRVANPGQEPRADILKRIIERNIVGVDIDSHAVRTAAFSLYLAMCDEIDPRQYWTQVHFPLLRGQNLVDADFFETFPDQLPADQQFDLVIGNAPWGKNSTTPAAKRWASNPASNWPISYGQLAPLFLPKGAELLKPSGIMSVLQPASLLFGQNENAKAFRKRLFETFDIEEVINLSGLRFGLFRDALSPACIITMRLGPPSTEPFWFCSPKPTRSIEDNFHVVIEPSDCNVVYADEAANDPTVMCVLRWGGRRDLEFVRSLSDFDNLAKLDRQGKVRHRDGIIRGDRQKVQPELVGYRILEGRTPPPTVGFVLDSSDLPRNNDPHTHGRGSTDYSAFSLPQMILKKTWQGPSGRFSAMRVLGLEPILCSHSYVSVSGPTSILERACAMYNSTLTAYYLFLTSSRLGTYIPEVLTPELLSVPLPPPTAEGMPALDEQGVDSVIKKAFGLKDADWVLVEDFVRFTLAEYRGSAEARSFLTDDQAGDYCECVLRVIRAGFGAGARVGATVLCTDRDGSMPLRVAAVHLGWPLDSSVRFERTESVNLFQQILTLQDTLDSGHSGSLQPLRRQRTCRFYSEVQIGGAMVPTVFVVKPNQQRYWTRSLALRDGDEIAADIMLWQARGE
jgi:hypothetical protein